MGEKKDKGKRGSLPTQMNLVIRIVAGVYLFYLAYSIYGNTGEIQGMERVFFLLVAVLFVVIGAGIVFLSLRAMQRGEYVGGSADTGREQETGAAKGGEQEDPDRIRFGESEDKGPQTDRIRFGEPETLPEGKRKEDES